MLRAAPHTDAARVPCIGICIRICRLMCFNIRKALSLIPRTPYATTASVRSPAPLEHRGGALHPLGLPRPSRGLLRGLLAVVFAPSGLAGCRLYAPARA